MKSIDFMTGINILGTATVMLCTIVVSYNHTIELFEAAGYRGWMAHVAVIAFELTFFLGGLNVVVARLRGDPLKWPEILGGVLGLFIVGWNNVKAGWPYGFPGVILGGIIPVNLFVSEANLSLSILRTQRKREASRTEREKPPTTPPPKCEENLAGREEVLAGREEAASTREEVGGEAEHPREKAKRVAWEIVRREGKPPTIRRLMREADVKEWPAREALKEVRALWKKEAKVE